jgi:hypothetical protein
MKISVLLFKSALIIATLFSFSNLSAELIYPDYEETIAKIVSDCKSVEKQSKRSELPVENQAPTQYITCFTEAMVAEMRNLPQYRELILESALRANPKHIPALIKAAIEAGMAPLVTLMRAIEIYPNDGEDIGVGAMSAGVDPFVVTEATSGLKN